jgi:hypothetical protein
MQLIEHPPKFKQGIRIVMKVLRGKDGGLAKPDHHAKKIITKNELEWQLAVDELIVQAEPNERIYASCDARNFDKAVHELKRRQLDADLYAEAMKQDFYIDIKNRFISCLASPKSRQNKLFLIDCDTEDEYLQAFSSPLVVDNLIHQYTTKNGIHMITEPFNPTKVNLPKGKIQQNALILVGY